MTDAEQFLRSQGLELTSTSGYDLLTFGPWKRSYDVRDTYIAKYGFSVPNQAALKAISAHNPILEIGAGSGYWSYELKQLGVSIVPTDPALGRYGVSGDNFFWKKPWIPVEKLTAVEAIKLYSEHTLLIVWPDYDCDWPTDALQVYHGEHLFYVGEGNGGCTGNDAFHQYLESNFICIDEIGIPQFYGIHDRLFCYQRKEKS